MRKAYLTIRSAILWAISGMHFAVVCTFLIVLAIFVDSRKNDLPQRLFFRNIMRLAGAMYNSAVTTMRLRDDDLMLFSFNGVPHLNEPQLRTFR